ncbi:MAG: protein kinase [Acidimicrobiales bacterium]
MDGRDLIGVPGLTDVEPIGAGGFGTVYRARDESHSRQVAIKMLSGVQLDERASRRFDRERQAMGIVGAHPHVAQVFSSGFAPDGRPYLIMEYAPGGSLADHLERSGALPWDEALDIVRKLASGVAAAHEQQVLHRDIKPANVLISAYGEPKLTDFGIASMLDGSQSTSNVSASVAYASPEQLEGRPPSTAMDVYGLGSLLFTLVAGRPAFVGSDDSIPAVMRRVFHESVPDLRPSGVPDELCVVIERAMAKAPGDRYGTAAELAAALGGIGGTVASSPGSFAPVVTGAADVGSVGLPTTAEGIASSPTVVESPAMMESPAGFLRAPRNRPPALVVTSAAAVLVVVAAALVAWLAFGGDGGQRPVTPAGEAVGADPEATGPTDGGPTDPGVADEATGPASSGDDGGGAGAGDQGDDGEPGPASEVLSVSVDCPDSFVLGERTACDIVSAGAVAGSWDLPGFSDGRIELETVPGINPIYIEPHDGSYVGAFFTLTATVESADGETVVSDHRFTVESSSATASLIDELNAVTTRSPVNFETGSATLRSTDAATVDEIAQLLGAAGDVRVEVGGHTDDVGPADANQSLSAARAAAVVDVLVAAGIPADRLVVAGYGASQPIAPNDTEAGRAQNRRIEFREVGSGPFVSIECPESFVIGVRTDCEIVTANAIEGRWRIDGFTDGEVELAVIPGSNQIYLQPDNEAFAGESFVLSVDVIDAGGTSVGAQHTFTLVTSG